jgi:predicted  nucleic acid-binding Zn-ribbon protein
LIVLPLAVSTAMVVQYMPTPSQARRKLQKENYLLMSMTKIAASLYQLQQLDLELERLIAEQQALVNSIQGESTLKKLLAENNIAQQQLQTGLQAQKEAEWALEELDSRLRRQEQRLYSGGVTNPKELYALQQEVQHLRAQQSRQEEMALEVILGTESLQKEANDTAEALRLAEDKWAEANAAGVIRRDELELKRQELQKKREQFATGIDAEFLKRYDALKRTKQGRAISKVEQNSCQWCRVILTPSEMQRVRTSADLQLCSNCGRVLYYDR